MSTINIVNSVIPKNEISCKSPRFNSFVAYVLAAIQKIRTPGFIAFNPSPLIIS